MRHPWLAPLTPLYAAGLALHNLRIERGFEQVRQLRWPVVSVGNLSIGGAGKTPLTIALARALTQHGLCVDILSRGYGRQSKQAARVRLNGTAEEFGDEPILMARETGLPVFVASQRYRAGLLAEKVSAEVRSGAVHLLDDGFQHRQLHRDVDILLLNRQDWTDSLLPAGNLREPRNAARRASVIAIPADEPELENELKRWGWQGPVWHLRRTMEVPAFDGPVVAFCGIARPDQFFRGLEAAGVEIAARIAFPDHHRFVAADLQRLLSAARPVGAVALVTTEKDQVRMVKLAAALPEDLRLKTARLRVEIQGEPEAIDWLQGRLREFCCDSRVAEA
jgi:tetraacyldisaccharide 4'-kinase